MFLISVISGFTALMESSRYGHLETARFLVESGANVEARANEYYTPWKSFLKPRARAAAAFNFSNFCYQWFHRVDGVLKRRTP
jgi:ankyrin repeat protein